MKWPRFTPSSAGWWEVDPAPLYTTALSLSWGWRPWKRRFWSSPMGHVLPVRRLPVCSWTQLPSKWEKPSQGKSPGITSEKHLPGLAVAVCWKSLVCMRNGTRSADDSQYLAGPHQPWPLWQVGGQASVYLGQSSQGLFLMEMEINSLPTAPSVHWWGALHVTNSAPWLQVVTGLAADVNNLTGKILSVG